MRGAWVWRSVGGLRSGGRKAREAWEAKNLRKRLFSVRKRRAIEGGVEEKGGSKAKRQRDGN